MAGSEVSASRWTEGAGSWAELVEQQRIPLFEAILDRCAVEKGHHFLDSGCASGGLAHRAALRGAVVSGYDVSEGMVALAQQRIPQGDFRVGSVDAPPFEDGSFDVLIACDCLFFAEDVSQATKELARMAKEDADVAIAVWELPEKSEYSTYFSAMIDELPQPPKGSPFSISEEGSIEALMEGAGLVFDKVGSIPVEYRYPSFERFWEAVSKFSVIQSMIDVAGEDRIRSAALNASKPCIQPSGELWYKHAFRVVTAKA